MSDHLTAAEREVYRSGEWIADVVRCVSCGCSEDNHADYGTAGIGRCLVCSCKAYVYPVNR